MRGRIASSISGSQSSSSATPALAARSRELAERVLEHRRDRRRAERHDARSRLELAQEEDLVDELGDLHDLGHRLLHERPHVLSGQQRRLEQGEQAGERGSQLVRDRGREAGAELLVGGQVALAREVDEALATPVHLVRHDERDHAALAGHEVGRQLVPFADPLDALARPVAREQDPVRLVEHDDGLPALLDEHAAANRLGVHSHPSNTRFAQCFRAHHGAQTHISVNAWRPLPRSDGMYLKNLVIGAAVAAALSLTAVASAAVILGTPGDDLLRGTPDADQISAFAGSDIVYAGAGNDDVRLGEGNDAARAGHGHDAVYGGRGNDMISAGFGGDRLRGGPDSDWVSGGNGRDRVSGNRGDDAVWGNRGADLVFGGWGADLIFGGLGPDRLHALAPDGQRDLLDCGLGRDRAFVLRSERPMTVLVGCEKVYVVDVLTADQQEGELAEADVEADVQLGG